MLDCPDQFASCASAWDSFEASFAAPPLRLVADLVDLPEAAATCDPTPLLGNELREILEHVDGIAPPAPVGHEVHTIPRHSRAEYLKLVGRELKLGKLSLHRTARGIGSVFAVPKSGDRQRAVWHGTLVSEASSKPVKPRRLANPAALLALDWPAGTRIRWSKRDAASFFDTLVCPAGLTTWFGRPPVTVAELLRSGELSYADIRHSVVDDEALGDLPGTLELFPCSRVWPMGYSWSSAVAQDTSLGLLRSGGFLEEQVICVEEPPPKDQHERLFVLTDDCLMAHVVTAPGGDKVFSSRDVRSRVGLLDEAMRTHGVQRKAEKDITCAAEITGMGCCLEGDPPRASPDAASARRCVLAVWGLSERKTVMPGAVASLLGVCQWFCLLHRPFFSVFRGVYAFAQQEPQDLFVDVTTTVLKEFTLFAALMPLLVADLARDYAPLIAASDAAPEFGFGVSLAPADPDTLFDLGRLAERRGDFVRFYA